MKNYEIFNIVLVTFEMKIRNSTLNKFPKYKSHFLWEKKCIKGQILLIFLFLVGKENI